MMLVNIIFAASFITFWPVLYFLLRNNTEPKKNIILGVTLPHSAHNDTETQAICQSFKKWLSLTMLAPLPLLLPPFFMKAVGPAITWYLVLFLLVIITPFVVFALHRNKLMTLKRNKNWYSEAAGHMLADIKAAAVPTRKFHFFWFLPPVAASLIPVIFMLYTPTMQAFASIYITFALITILFGLCYPLIFRLRSEVLNEDLTLTMALTRVRRYNWGKFWVIATWLTGALNLLLWAFSENIIASLIVIFSYTLLLIAVALQTEFAARIAQQKLTAEDSGEFYLDEDELWIWGMFYCNPNDSHFLVNDRIGMNMTFNLAKPAAKIIMGFTALLLSAMPFLGIWVWVEESVPPKLELTQTELTARHTYSQYTIPLDTIESIELIEELPPANKQIGSALDNLKKGSFRVQGYGNSRLCLHPQNPPFLVITAGGQTYILNDTDSDVTREIFLHLTPQ